MNKRKKRFLRSQSGFTLVELGVVMAIIAILAAITYPVYSGMKERAAKAEAKATMQEIRVELWAEFLESDEETLAAFDFDPTPYKAGGWEFRKASSGELLNTGYSYGIAAHRGTATELVLFLGDDGQAEFSDKT